MSSLAAAVREIGTVVVKPLRGGSSVGARLYGDPAVSDIQFESFLRRQHLPAVVQEYISGYDVTVGVLLDESKVYTLPPVEIRHQSAIYGETEKMRDHWAGAVRYIVPASMPEPILESLRSSSVSLVELCGFRGAVRFDFRITDDDLVYFLEANTNPGLSMGSNIALAAKAVGLSFIELISFITLTASYDDTASGCNVRLLDMM